MPYILDEQVGFLLRLAIQRHGALFQSQVPLDLTNTQFAALMKLAELGECSQNDLGRRTAMDVATIKGVVDRLRKKGLIALRDDPSDRRRALLSLSPEGKAASEVLGDFGHSVSAETLAPLSADERRLFLDMLRKLT